MWTGNWLLSSHCVPTSSNFLTVWSFLLGLMIGKVPKVNICPPQTGKVTWTKRKRPRWHQHCVGGLFLLVAIEPCGWTWIAYRWGVPDSGVQRVIFCRPLVSSGLVRRWLADHYGSETRAAHQWRRLTSVDPRGKAVARRSLGLVWQESMNTKADLLSWPFKATSIELRWSIRRWP